MCIGLLGILSAQPDMMVVGQARTGTQAVALARKHSLANYADVKRVFIAATKLPEAVVDKQLKERTALTFNRIGPEQRDSILQAGLALQKAGVIKADVDVKATVDSLIDDRWVAVTN